MTRLIFALLTAVTSLFAWTMVVNTFFDDGLQNVALQALLRGLIAAFITIEGAAMVVFAADRHAAPIWAREISYVGALALIALAAAGLVWTVHLGLTSGDWDGFAFVGGGLVGLQGVLAAWMAPLRGDAGNAPPSSA